MVSITALLIIAAFVSVVATIMGKAPVWLSVLFIVLVLLFQILPLK